MFAHSRYHVRRLVPVVLNVVEVKLDDGPERVGHVVGAIAVGEKPVRVGDDGRRAQSRAICGTIRMNIKPARPKRQTRCVPR